VFDADSPIILPGAGADDAQVAAGVDDRVAGPARHEQLHCPIHRPSLGDGAEVETHAVGFESH